MRFVSILFLTLLTVTLRASVPYLTVKPNQLEMGGKRFFWIADDASFLLQKTNHQDASLYFETRKKQGFTVVTCEILHNLSESNYYGDIALRNNNLIAPYTTNGSDFSDYVQYDYWDNVEWIIDEAAKYDLYVAVIPFGKKIAEKVEPTVAMSVIYTNLLCKRLSRKSNVIWLLGGGVSGDLCPKIWKKMAESIKTHDSKQLVSFLPTANHNSKEWFNSEKWIDFQCINEFFTDENATINALKFLKKELSEKSKKPIVIAQSTPVETVTDSTLQESLQTDIRRKLYSAFFLNAAGTTYSRTDVRNFEGLGSKTIKRVKKEEMAWFKALQGNNSILYLNQFLNKYFSEDVELSENFVFDTKNCISVENKKYTLIYLPFAQNIEVPENSLKNKKSANWFYPQKGTYQTAEYQKSSHGFIFNLPQNISETDDIVLILEK